MTPKKETGRLPGLDVCRGIASLMVVVFHALLTLEKGNESELGSFSWCARGVDLFFVLSGFVIALVHSHEWGNSSRFKNYLSRRMWRIYPAMWAVAIPYIFIRLMARSESTVDSGLNFTNFLTSVLLLPYVDPPIPSVLWTLKHEVLFYFVAGLFFFNIRIAIITTSLWLACCIPLALYCYPSNFLIDFFFSSFNLEFGLGMLLGFLVASGIVKPKKVFLLFGVVLFAILAYFLRPVSRAESWIVCPTTLKEVIGYGIASGLVVLGSAGFSKVYEATWSRFILFIGTASYSIYLVHFPVIVIFARLFAVPMRNIPFMASLALLVGLGVAAGMLFHLIIERRILNFARRRFASSTSSISTS